MSISGQQNINIGFPNQPTGSDSLYTAFTKIQDNFNTLFASSSPYNTFSAGEGINVESNANIGTVTITNEGVTNIIAGLNIVINRSNGNVTISATGTGNGNGGGTLSSIGVQPVSNSRLVVTNSPLVVNGNIGIDLAASGVMSGVYVNPTITVDSYGRITTAVSNDIEANVAAYAAQAEAAAITSTSAAANSAADAQSANQANINASQSASDAANTLVTVNNIANAVTIAAAAEGTFPNTTAGLGNTTSNQYFYVADGTSPNKTLGLYLNSSNVANLQTTVLTNYNLQTGTGAVGRPLLTKLNEFYTPGDFGVVDDPSFLSSSTDQYTALQAWLTACQTDGKSPYVPQPLRVYTSQPLTFYTGTLSGAARYFTVEMRNLRICTTADSGYIQGGALPTSDLHQVYLPSVQRRTMDWSKDPHTKCGGVIIINHYNCTFYPGRISNFTVGLQCWSENYGFAYNQIIGGVYFDNRFCEALIVADDNGGGFTNENKWFGGNCNYSSSSNAMTAAFCAGVYFGNARPATVASQNNNIWYGRCFEMTTAGTHPNVTEGVPVWLNNTGAYNRWKDSRCEGWRGPLMHVGGNIDGDANSTQGLYNEIDFSFLGSNDNYQAIREVKGAYGNLVFLPGRPNTVTWNSGPLRDMVWSGGGANSVRVSAPFVIRQTSSGTDLRALTSSNVIRTNMFGVQAATSGQIVPGFYIDTSKCKQLDFSVESRDGYAGRWIFKAYDANLQPLGNTSTDAYGTQRNIKFPSASTTTTAGGSWSQGSDLTSPLRISLTEEVKYLFVAKAAGTNSCIINAYQFTAYMRAQNSASVGSQADKYGPPPIFDPLADGEGYTGKTANANPGTSGTIGFYFKGQQITNNDTTSGQPNGWICTTAGVLATARVNNTAYQVGRIILNTANNAYYALTAGTTGVTEPTGTTPGTDYVDGTVTWRYLAPKAAFTPFYTSATETGRILYIEDFGGGVTKTAAENKTAFDAAVAALPASGGQLAFASHEGVYQMNAVTLSRDNVVLGDGVKKPTIQFPNITSSSGLTITGNGITLNNIRVYGPGSASTFLGLQCAVSVLGSSTSARVTDFQAHNCEFGYVGRSGIRMVFVDRIKLIDCDTVETAYIGTEFMSCNYVTQRGGTINVLNSVGTSGNAYGTAFSHDSTNYDTNPNPGTPQATNPFCNVVLVDGVTVIGPKIWQAIDTHGAYNITVVNCKTFAAGRGISLTTGSGAAAQYAGWQNIAHGNIIDTKLPDGTLPSGLVIADGLTIRGPTTGTAQWSIIATGNTIRGYGIANATGTGSINATTGCRNYIISGNIFEDWIGSAIAIGGNGTAGIIITDNIFGDHRDPSSEAGGNGACIALFNNITGRFIIGGNVHNPSSSANAARWGIGGAGYNPSSPLITMNVNDFAACTIGYTNTFDYQLHGPGFPGAIVVKNTGGTITVDLSSSRLSPGVPIKVRFESLTSNITVTNLTPSLRNQRVILENVDATYTVTMTRSNAYLPGGVSAVLGQWDTIDLVRGPTLWSGASSVNLNS